MASPTILPGQLRLIVAIAAVHIIAWYAFLSQIPLGLYPTPQESSLIDTAFALAAGQVNQVQSVSAYEFLLSIAARFVSDPSDLVLLARLINALALILTTCVCAHAAGKYWKKNRSVWITGLLTGLNPVVVFWSAEVGPTLLAVFCAGLGFAFLLRWLRHPSTQRSLLIGLVLSLGIMLETSLIFFALLWPLTAWLYPNRNRSLHLAAALVFPSLLFLLITLTTFQLQSIPELQTANLGRGVYEVFNSHEPYDGKSYGLHKALNLFLFINPIHWGLVFILALGGAYIRLKNGHQGNSIAAMLICLAVFALSYALNDAGSKARALLYPLLAVYAGGMSMMPKVWKHAGKMTKRKILAGLLLVTGVCYSDFYDARSSSNWEADYSYLAKANLALERNNSAIEWAQKAIALNPERDDMRSIILQARFNEWALAPSPAPISSETAKIGVEAARNANTSQPTTKAIEALYLFKLREKDQAIEIWEQIRDQSALALICLYWTGNIEKPGAGTLRAYSKDHYYDLLEKVIAINRNALAYSEGEETLDNMLAFAH